MLICSLIGKLGFGMTEALATIRSKRGLEAPNTVEQLEWLEENWEALSTPTKAAVAGRVWEVQPTKAVCWCDQEHRHCRLFKKRLSSFGLPITL